MFFFYYRQTKPQTQRTKYYIILLCWDRARKRLRSGVTSAYKYGVHARNYYIYIGAIKFNCRNNDDNDDYDDDNNNIVVAAADAPSKENAIRRGRRRFLEYDIIIILFYLLYYILSRVLLFIVIIFLIKTDCSGFTREEGVECDGEKEAIIYTYRCEGVRRTYIYTRKGVG